MMHLDGCKHDPVNLHFDAEDYLVCEHGERLVGWRSVAKGDPAPDSSQGRQRRADFRRSWMIEKQAKVLYGNLSDP
jgi:hypothetical protein